MELKILLPFRVFTETSQVLRIVFETSQGAYGLLPQRLDCVAAITPGILTYETEKTGIHYVAVDQGILVKAGSQALVSVRNAIGGADLGKLGELVKKEFNEKTESESKARSTLQRLESGFMHRFNKFRNQ